MHMKPQAEAWEESGQFERTLLIADEQSYVSYLEGCTAQTSASERRPT